MKRMKIRLIWDDCRPTIDRRPITYEDIENDIHLQEFESEDDLIKHLCNLSKCNEDDLEDCGEDNKAKIDYNNIVIIIFIFILICIFVC